MPTDIEEVGLAPPAPHPLDRPVDAVDTDTADSAAGHLKMSAHAAAAVETARQTVATKDGATAAAAAAAVDRCAGCNVSNVPLLACDANLDVDSPQPEEEQEHERQRFCSDCMVGKKVRVFWPVDNQWYIGKVQQYDPSTGEHLLKYQDGDTEWVMIGESNTTVAPLPEMTMGDVTAASSNNASRTGTPLLATSIGHHDGTALLDSIPPISPAPGHLLDQRIDSPRTYHMLTSGGHPGMLGLHPSGLIPPGYSAVTPDEKWQSQQEAREARMGTGSLSSHLPPGYSTYPPPPYGSYPPPLHGYNPYHYPPMPSRSHLEDVAPGSGADGGPPKHAGFHSLGMRDGTASPAPNAMSSSVSGAGGKRKNGPKAWTKEEDSLLLSIVQSMKMPMKWSLVAQKLPERTGKQCRERYVNHLNPRLKVTDWSPLEDATIFHLYNTLGSHWAKMSKIVIGRTDNGIKNRFHNLRRQLEREDEHRLRLSAARDFPDEIRLELVREFPEELRGKSAELWDIKSGLSVLAAQSVLGGGVSRNAGRFGPFKIADNGDVCVRCGFMLPSVQTGIEICTKTGWCQTCARMPPHVTGAMLRECLNLRRCQDEDKREIIESWDSGKLPSQ